MLTGWQGFSTAATGFRSMQKQRWFRYVILSHMEENYLEKISFFISLICILCCSVCSSHWFLSHTLLANISLTLDFQYLKKMKKLWQNFKKYAQTNKTPASRSIICLHFSLTGVNHCFGFGPHGKLPSSAFCLVCALHLVELKKLSRRLKVFACHLMFHLKLSHFSDGF